MGPDLPRGRTGTPEGWRKWASLSFYRGRGQASSVGASQSPGRRLLLGRFTHANTHTALHTHTASTPCWMKMVVVWLHNPRVPHHVIAVVSALLISAVPLGLYNWDTADSRDLTFTPNSPLCLSQSRWQTPLDPTLSFLVQHAIWHFDTFLFLGTFQTTLFGWGDKPKQVFFVSP